MILRGAATPKALSADDAGLRRFFINAKLCDLRIKTLLPEFCTLIVAILACD